jgi:hypothetical protein
MGISNSYSQEFETLGFSHSEFEKLCECRQASLVDPRLNVPVSNPLQIDHGGCYIAMSHPLLQRPNVNPVLQVARRVCVAELVEKPSAAEGPLRTTVNGDRSILQYGGNGYAPHSSR